MHFQNRLGLYAYFDLHFGCPPFSGLPQHTELK
jgi:hypothetical protein